MATAPRPNGRRATRARNARYSAHRPVLALRVSPEENDQIAAAGGLRVVLSAFLAGDTVPAGVAEHQAEEAAGVAAAEVENHALELLTERDAELVALRDSLAEWESYANALEGRLKAAEARLPQVQAAQHQASYDAGYRAGLAAGQRQEADRRARLAGVADAAEERQAAAVELVTLAREAGWHVSWSALAREALRRDCLAEVGRAVPQEHRRRYDAASIGLAVRAGR